MRQINPEDITEEQGCPSKNRNNKLVASTSSYEVYINRRTGKIIIYQTEYKAGNPAFTLEGLEKLAEGLRKKDS